MSEQIKLTEESFESLKIMLNSKDPNDYRTALEAICNLDFKLNVVYILLLFKETSLSPDSWSDHGKKVYTRLKSNLPDLENGVSLKQCMEILVLYMAPIEDLQFFLNRFSNHLAKTLHELGYKQIDTIQLTINTK